MGTTPHRNRLGLEKSPYLLQHRDNPVDWYPWGAEAFDKARREAKPIFLSIGYSTCHWCHVMEEDSFEKEEVAAVLNAHFISIKVDREERPDIDQIYMDAVVGLTGHGGWPMSVFLTPELKPFYGGTFFWRPQFLKLLEAIHNAWEKERPKLIASSDGIVQRLQELRAPAGEGMPDATVFHQALQSFSKSFDARWGGFGGAPKFPRSMALSLLLRIHRRAGNPEALKMVEVTLEKMARGGMYDHLGGGFHRYATDEQWLVPHFEKMLYDNALLAVAYLEVYQVTKNESAAAVAREILDYVLRDMTDPQGGFSSAEDADSEGAEGKFYVWKDDELKNILSHDEFALIQKTYGVSGTGNFEGGTNILHFTDRVDWGIKRDLLHQSAQRKLMAVRAQRIRPHRDDKILTDWNGLMMSGFAKGAQVLQEKRYLEAAQKAARFLKEKLWSKGVLHHRYRAGESRFRGYLTDYAFVIQGLLDLYEADFDPSWIAWARELQSRQDELFWDSAAGGYFFTEEGAADLVMRKKELDDGALPSGNAVAALNLQRLFGFTFDMRYRDRAEKTLRALSGMMARHPMGIEYGLIALDFWLGGSKEIAIVGKRGEGSVEALLQDLRASFIPNKVIAVGEGGVPLLEGKPRISGQPTFYICEQGVCRKPTTEVEEAKRQLSL